MAEKPLPALFVPIVKLGIPVDTAAFRRPIQHRPERIEVWSSARVLSRVGHFAAHLSAIKVVDFSVALGEDAETGNVGVVGADVGARVLPRRVGEK